MQLRPKNVLLLTTPLRTASIVGLFCAALTTLAALPARAEVILQTATGGFSAPGGVEFNSMQYLGARFQTAQSFQLANVQINARTISGNNAGNGLVFAAIVPLSSLTAFPNEGNGPLIADANPVEFHTFTAPTDTSALITISFSSLLSAGTYAVVFGSGEFGATGSGIAPPNGTDIGAPSYFFLSTGPNGFRYDEGGFGGTTFIVNGAQATGAAAPEPGSLALMGLGVLPMIGLIARRRRAA